MNGCDQDLSSQRSVQCLIHLNYANADQTLLAGGERSGPPGGKPILRESYLSFAPGSYALGQQSRLSSMYLHKPRTRLRISLRPLASLDIFCSTCMAFQRRETHALKRIFLSVCIPLGNIETRLCISRTATAASLNISCVFADCLQKVCLPTIADFIVVFFWSQRWSNNDVNRARHSALAKRRSIMLKAGTWPTEQIFQGRNLTVAGMAVGVDP